VTIALGYATPVGNGTFQLHFNGSDPNSYFPSTYSYILGQTAGFDASKGATLGQFLCYAVSAGQVAAPQLGYARLSAPLVEIAENAIAQIPGAPPKASCFAAGAPPPPPPPSCNGCVNAITGGSNGGGGGGRGAGSGSGKNGTGGSAGSGGTSGAAARCTSPAPLSKTKTTTTTATHRTTATSAPKPTTTTAAPCATSGAGAAGAGQSGTESVDAQLANAASTRPSGSSTGTSGIWLILGGVLAAWGGSALWSRRKAQV
jgi:hypothetical protein